MTKAFGANVSEQVITACKLRIAKSTIVNYRISGQSVLGKYTITRKKRNDDHHALSINFNN